MRTTLMVFAAGLSLGGCVTAASAPPAPAPTMQSAILTKEQIEAVHAGTKRSLKDPNSAMFGELKAASDGKGIVYVCGYVNARNSFGGYTGMQPFHGVMGGAPPIFAAAGFGSSPGGIAATRIICGQYGITI